MNLLDLESRCIKYVPEDFFFVPLIRLSRPKEQLIVKMIYNWSLIARKPYVVNVFSLNVTLNHLFSHITTI